MTPEKELRRALVTSWAQIESHLPEDFNSHYYKFARDYFRAQLRYAQGRTFRGKRIMQGLVKRPGYEEFETDHEGLLAAIDIAVKGKTWWEVPPDFTIDKINL